MTLRDITTLTPGELRAFLRAPLDARTRNVLVAERRRRENAPAIPAPAPPRVPDEPGRLYTPAEVATLFGVHPKTVTAWAKQGLLPHIHTPGGHRRYRAAEVDALLATPGDPPAGSRAQAG